MSLSSNEWKGNARLYGPTSSCDLNPLGGTVDDGMGNLVYVQAVRTECGHLDSKEDADKLAMQAANKGENTYPCPQCRTSCNPAKTVPVHLANYADVPRLIHALEAKDKKIRELEAKLALLEAPSKIATNMRELLRLKQLQKIIQRKITHYFAELNALLRCQKQLENQFHQERAKYQELLNSYQLKLSKSTSIDIERDSKEAIETASSIARLSKEFEEKSNQFLSESIRFKTHPKILQNQKNLFLAVKINKRIAAEMKKTIVTVKELTEEERKNHIHAAETSQKQSTTLILPLLAKLQSTLEKPRKIISNHQERKSELQLNPLSRDSSIIVRDLQPSSSSGSTSSNSKSNKPHSASMNSSASSSPHLVLRRF